MATPAMPLKLTLAHDADRAEGTLAKNAEGRLAVTKCVLHPRVELAPGVTVHEVVAATEAPPKRPSPTIAYNWTAAKLRQKRRSTRRTKPLPKSSEWKS